MRSLTDAGLIDLKECTMSGTLPERTSIPPESSIMSAFAPTPVAIIGTPLAMASSIALENHSV
jgi:hypothetical protein